jgi:hypothetical protein
VPKWGKRKFGRKRKEAVEYSNLSISRSTNEVFLFTKKSEKLNISKAKEKERIGFLRRIQISEILILQ